MTTGVTVLGRAVVGIGFSNFPDFDRTYLLRGGEGLISRTLHPASFCRFASLMPTAKEVDPLLSLCRRSCS